LNYQSLLEFHREIVSISSLSRQETRLADFVEDFLTSKGAEVWRHGDCVMARAGKGRRLLLNSHLDTVPPNDQWTRPPWKPTVEEGRVYGLGANDAKASGAAMTAAFLHVLEKDGPCEVVLMLVPMEETGGGGTEIAMPFLLDTKGWRPEGVVVGEPTQLDVGVAQKGMMILELTEEGDACHAGNVTRLGAINPIWNLAKDIVALQSADLGPTHPMLGAPSLQPTMLKGASVHNQVPGEALCVIDVRTVPGISHAELLERLQATVVGHLHGRSTRLQPYQCDEDAAIVKAALKARPASKLFASPTMSDQVFCQGLPAIKCGPGLSARSHTPDEYVYEDEIVEGLQFYRTLIATFAEHP
jgi:acetylornithine deacetylase